MHLIHSFIILFFYKPMYCIFIVLYTVCHIASLNVLVYNGNKT